MEDPEIKFKIGGMDCPDCAKTVEKGVAACPGVTRARVDFVSETLSVSGKDLDPSRLQREVKNLGYRAEPAGKSASQTSTLFIADMDCADEERTVRAALKSVDGVSNLRFNLIKRELTVDHVGPGEELVAAIRRAGLKALSKESISRTRDRLAPRWKFWSVVAATVIVILGWILEMADVSPYLYRPVFLLGMIIGGWQIAYKGFIAARRLRLDMNFLMTSAVIGAAIIGEWTEAGAVIVLFAIAQLLETYSMGRSRRAISGLIDLSPRFATVIKDDGPHVTPVGEVAVGDRVLVKPGERIAVDGSVISGRSSVNQAAITGESKPVDKTPGDHVYAGTLNTEGALEIVATHAPGDTTLDRIIKLVEEAQAQRAPSQSFVDKFSTYYTPAVVGMAVTLAIAPPLLVGGDWTDWIYRSLALLVIACPCALVISTPITIVSALANAARNGVLIKGGVFLENAYKVSALAFDKTGTLTRGKPAVSRIMPLNGLSQADVLTMAASIESHSEHPIARAIVRQAEKAGHEIIAPRDFRSLPGKGAVARLDGREILLGNQGMFEEMGLLDQELLGLLKLGENVSETPVFIGTSEQVLGLIGISDELRPESARVVSELKDEGIAHIALLTGDNSLTGIAIGKAVGVDEIHADLLPQDKVEVIKQLRAKYGDVAMVGDGVNDAPALATASIGVAMGAAGSDSALETADIALMADELEKVPWMIRLSRKAHGIIVANIFLAIAIKFAFVILAVLGLATLWMAVFADMGVSLLVIFNGMRALRSN